MDTANAENAGGRRERLQVEKAERDEKRTGTLNGFRGALPAPRMRAQETTLDIEWDPLTFWALIVHPSPA
ncbi:MAG: hypothetical protein JO151_05370 [Verrucomicrobia bacterium]|nr:hypothetical protein [Verrucomicrobiota bacterium]